GFHTGHGNLDQAIIELDRPLRELGYLTHAVHASDLCDGTIQGTCSMLRSLPSRDAMAMMYDHHIMGASNRVAAIGVGTCDKGLPAVFMGAALHRDTPIILVPGGTTLLVSGGP